MLKHNIPKSYPEFKLHFNHFFFFLSFKRFMSYTKISNAQQQNYYLHTKERHKKTQLGS